MQDKTIKNAGTINKLPKSNVSKQVAVGKLRREAEQLVNKNSNAVTISGLTIEAINELLHDLQVHQIELEMQNEELRESTAALDNIRSRYFDLYDLAPVGYLTLNKRGLIQQANLTAVSLLGMTRSTLIKEPISRLILKDDQDIYYLHHKKLLASGDSQSFDLRLIKSDYTPFWANMVITQHDGFEAENIQQEIRIVISDISARKHAEQALAISEAHYQTLFNSIDEGFCVIEVIFNSANKPVDYRYLEINPAFITQSGIQNALGKCISEFAPDHDPEWYEIYGNVVTTGKSIRFIKEAKELDERWFDVYAFRLGSVEDKKVAVIFTDTSLRKQEEIKINTARLIAEKANMAKTEFLSSMSHELRTPLNAILGFAQLIEASNPPLTTIQKHNTDQIIKAGWYLLSLLNEILDLSVMDSGKLLLSVETLSLTEILNDSVAMLSIQAQKQSISLTVTPCETSYFVSADYVRLKQVFVNLLSNAIKYNISNGSVTLNYIKTSKERIRVCIQDTGEGLAPEEISQLFQPFNRLGKQFGKEEGTGIGLVICKRIIESMNGAIGVESTVGKGCAFWVELDLVSVA